jgi:hypothetical protein
MGALQFAQFVTELFASGVMAIPRFRVFGFQKQAKDSRNLYAKRSLRVASGRQIINHPRVGLGRGWVAPSLQALAQIDIQADPGQYR